MPAWGELFGRRSVADWNSVSGRMSSSEVSLARGLQGKLLRFLPRISVLPVPPRSGGENRARLKNLVQSLVQLRAEKGPISPLGSSLLR